MKAPRSEDVQRLYQRYPFPHGSSSSGADFQFSGMWLTHFRPGTLSGYRNLEAGCGTGNKLTALAKMYPEAHFTGIDLSEPSLAVAKELAKQYELTNIEYRQSDLLKLDEESKYDIIQSIGVVHHLSDPQEGLDKLCRALKDDGVMMIWLYHPYGEHQRLQQRKLLHTLWGEQRDDLTEGERLMKALDLQLDSGHYGPRALGSDGLAGNADAYMHPIVEAYELGESLDMLREAGCTWASVDFLTIRWGLKFVNLAEVEDPNAPTNLVDAGLRAAFHLRLSEILPDESLHERFRALSKRDQLKVIELVVNPRGFQVIAGRGNSHERFDPRIQGNVIELA